MAKKKSANGRPGGSKKALIVDWLKRNPEGTVAQCIKATHTHIHSGQFSGCRAELGLPVRRRDKRTSPKANPTFALDLGPDKVELLQDENSFLRWWNQGERKGWVDRLLEQIQKPEGRQQCTDKATS